MTLHNLCTYQNTYSVTTSATYLHRNIILCMRIAMVSKWSTLFHWLLPCAKDGGSCRSEFLVFQIFPPPFHDSTSGHRMCYTHDHHALTDLRLAIVA